MLKKTSLPVALIVLWLAMLACGQTTTVPTVDPNAAGTAIVETINALNALASPTPLPAELSPTPEIFLTDTPGGLLPLFTHTPSVPMVSVSVATFCRLGPGAEYEKVGILLVGESTEVLGRDAFNLFYYVRNPDVGPENCWISAEFATISGNALAIFAQPPPSDLSSDVEAEYLGMGKCSNRWWSDMRIRNLSNATFRSINLIIGDGATNSFRSMNVNGFPFTDGCAAPTSVDDLGPGTSVRISSPEFDYDLAGAPISVTITVCTEIGMRGTCVSKTLSYTP